MNRLRRFYEKMPHGEKSSRVAYVIKITALPEESVPGAEWTEDASFHPAEAVLDSPWLKQVFLAAIAKGCEIVTTREALKAKEK